MKNLKCYTLALCTAIVCNHAIIKTSSRNTPRSSEEGKITTKAPLLDCISIEKSRIDNALDTSLAINQRQEQEQQPDLSPSSSTKELTLPTTQQEHDFATKNDLKVASDDVIDWDDAEDDGLKTALDFVQQPGENTTEQPTTISSSVVAAASTNTNNTVPVVANLQHHNLVGSPYVILEVPKQTATIIRTKWAIESYSAYLIRTIKAGQFDAAHSRSTLQGQKLDPNINEHSGRALAEGTTALTTTLKLQGKAHEDHLAEQHRILQANLDPVYLIAQAAQRDCAKGSINEERIRHELMVLKEMQRVAEDRTDRAHQENKEREEAIKKLRTQYVQLLQHPEEQDQISPSKRKQSPQ